MKNQLIPLERVEKLILLLRGEKVPLGQQLAERLRQDGLKVWPCPPKPTGEGGFGEWVLRPGDSTPAKTEAGLPHFTLQPLLRAPLNRERRFIPLRLDDDAHRTKTGAN